MQATGKKKNPWWLYGSVKGDFVCLLVLQQSFSCWALDWRGPQLPSHGVCVCCFPTRTRWSWSSPAVGQRADRGFTLRVTRNSIPSQIASRPIPHTPALSQFDRWATDSTLDPGPLLDLRLSHHKWDRWKRWWRWYHLCFEWKATICHCYTRSPCSFSLCDNQLSIYWLT